MYLLTIDTVLSLNNIVVDCMFIVVCTSNFLVMGCPKPQAELKRNCEDVKNAFSPCFGFSKLACTSRSLRLLFLWQAATNLQDRNSGASSAKRVKWNLTVVLKPPNFLEKVCTKGTSMGSVSVGVMLSVAR